MLDHARTHHEGALLERVTTFPSSAFTLGLSANAVDCILCLQLFRHVGDSEHRLALLREFHRVSRDTVIVSVQIEGHLNIGPAPHRGLRSEEHTSELQSLMRISYAVFCLNKKTIYI